MPSDESDKCKNHQCSFYGSDKFSGYCSGCITDQESSDASQIHIPNSCNMKKRKSAEITVDDVRDVTSPSQSSGPSEEDQKTKKRKVYRCGICKKKVGLLGFDCRCGGLFCSAHRGDKDHDCQFDYKTVQRAELAKKNPRIVGEKVSKI